MGHINTEIIQFEHFLKLLNLSSEYEEGIEPEPDFKINYKGRLIGIEHTRLFHSKDLKGDDIVRHNVITDRIVADAQNSFKLKSPDRLTVYVDFASSYGLSVPSKIISRTEAKELTKFLSEFVVKNTPAYDAQVSFDQFDMMTGKYILPDKIDRISIYNKYECWAPSRGGVVPNIMGVDLNQRIKSKDDKIKNYRIKYDEIWLLIVENQWHQENYYDFSGSLAIEVESRFNRVFILRAGNDELVECTNSVPIESMWNGKLNF
jgi:hypothetical protein